jgi:hypothetical protein
MNVIPAQARASAASQVIEPTHIVERKPRDASTHWHLPCLSLGTVNRTTMADQTR